MRNRDYGKDTSAIIKRMTEEIYQLAEEQAKALKKATFLGMTTDEASRCDWRRDRISRLFGEVQHLQGLKGRSD